MPAASTNSFPFNSNSSTAVVQKICQRSFAVWLLAVLLLPGAGFMLSAIAQETSGTVQAPTATIQWSPLTGVTKYRLQIATDESFSDVLVDRVITGNEYIVGDLAVGRYYWRISIARHQASHFLNPVPFEVKADTTRALPSNKTAEVAVTTATPAANKIGSRVAMPGWSAPTGEIVRLMAVQLRPGGTQDFLAVNSEGTVYALDGSRGIALWITRFTLAPSDARVRITYKQFAPLVLNSSSSSRRILIAFDNGVRALDGASGREVWNSQIAGRPFTGVAVESGRNGSPEIYLVGEKPDTLFVLDSNNGQLAFQVSLLGNAIGAPILFTTGKQRLMLVPLTGGRLQLLTMNGTYSEMITPNSEVTTQPVVVQTARGTRLLVGTRNGLAAFESAGAETAAFRPMGTIVLEGGDYPVGSLSVADLDGDKTPEVVMTTSSGRVVVIDVGQEKIRWSVDVGNQAVPAFADVNDDSRLDILLPGKKNFALALSGADGSIIWESGDEPSQTANWTTAARALVIGRTNKGSLIVVGNDRPSSGLRAVELIKSSAKSDQR